MGFLHHVLWIFFIYSRISYCIVYNSTALILGIGEPSINQASYLLDGYGLAYEAYQILNAGQNLPPLESQGGGNYGLFIVISQVQVNRTSLLTAGQWQNLYDYQIKYGVRMIHLNVVPSAEFGVKVVGSCCDAGTEQNITIVESVAADEFPWAGLRVATLSTSGLFHYQAAILPSNASTTTAVAEFQPNAQFSNQSVAGVINKFNDGREQMAFFLAVGNWSTTSTYLGHAYLNWGYRGTYQGYRRIHLQTQVDDLFLGTVIFNSEDTFRIRPEDLEQHIQWMDDLNDRLNPGSSYFIEFGFNSNGNLIYDYTAGLNSTQFTCDEPVFLSWTESTGLEYVKPLGTGHNLWPNRPDFVWTGQCIFLDPLARFFANTSNRDAFGLVSHTFTHMALNNATYHDATLEISFNLANAELFNFTNAAKFSGSGLIPPAITGLHNGDVIRAWSDNGLWNAIGDNTRPFLRNPLNFHWPLMTDMANNGFDGYQITPRFATRIYYDCDEIAVNVNEWISTGGGSEGDTIYTLFDAERSTVTNQLLSLFHDPYMFHQPNLRSADVEEIMINGTMQRLSLLQIWVETVTAELSRLVEWPIVTLKHDHIAELFNRRMLRDACQPFIQYLSNNGSLSGFTVSCTTGNTCEETIPVTIAGPLVDAKGFVTERKGTDPTTLWVKLDGQPISFDIA